MSSCAHAHYTLYYTQVVKGWDDKLVEQWRLAENENAILTTYIKDVSELPRYEKNPGRLLQTTIK